MTMIYQNIIRLTADLPARCWGGIYAARSCPMGGLWLFSFSLVLFLVACDDDTAQIGTSVMPEQDQVTASTETFPIASQTLQFDSIPAKTNDCYIGNYIDAATGIQTTCGFMAQFHIMENYSLPSESSIVKNARGVPVCDSCALHFFVDKYYGDSLAAMKMEIRELSSEVTLDEEGAYFSNLNPAPFVNQQGLRLQAAYSVNDLTNKLTSTSTTTRAAMSVKVPASYGQTIMQKYYKHPDWFAGSYQFIRNVLPGFYICTAGGVGAMMHVNVLAFDVYFRYHVNADSIAVGMQRVGSTGEVIQTTSTRNDFPSALLSPANPFTYVTSPAGLYTQLTLPIDDILGGRHEGDSLNAASLVLPALGSDATQSAISAPGALQPPTTLLLLPQEQISSFFLSNKLPDTRLYADYSTKGTYTWTNLAPLIAQLRSAREQGADVHPTDTPAQRQAKYEAWQQKHPDWNKVAVVPITVNYRTYTSGYGTTSREPISVSHDMGLSSVRLLGGSLGASGTAGQSSLRLEVVYSRFQ